MNKTQLGTMERYKTIRNKSIYERGLTTPRLGGEKTKWKRERGTRNEAKLQSFIAYNHVTYIGPERI